MFGTKIGAIAFGDLEILSDLGRDIHTYGQKSAKKISFFGGFSESEGHETWRNAKKNFSIFGPITICFVL